MNCAVNVRFRCHTGQELGGEASMRKSSMPLTRMAMVGCVSLLMFPANAQTVAVCHDKLDACSASCKRPNDAYHDADVGYGYCPPYMRNKARSR